LRFGRLHDAKTLVRSVCVPNCPAEVIPVGFSAFADHISASLACGFGLLFVLAAFRPSAQFAVLTRRSRFALRCDPSTARGAVADKFDTVNRTFHARHNT
jgi:hypothetical protein